MKIESKSKNNCEIFKEIVPGAQKQRLKFIEIFIRAIVICQDMNYRKISNVMDTAAKSLSNYRRIQRFVAQFKIAQAVLARWIVRHIQESEDSRLTLAMDRTNWKFGTTDINYLVLAVCFKGMAIPLFYQLLDKRGNSSTEERIKLMKRFIREFGAYRINYLLADREFIGQQWQAWLITEQIPFYIRIRNAAKVWVKGKEKKAFKLFKHLPCNRTLHKNNLLDIYGTPVYLSGKKILDKKGEIDYVLLISYFEPRQSFEKYSMRWQIEHLFRAIKSSGFNMESTHVTELERLTKLMSLITIAFFWAYKTGEWLIKKGKESIKVKKHGRNEISIFKLGLNYLCRAVSTGFSPHLRNIYSLLSCT